MIFSEKSYSTDKTGTNPPYQTFFVNVILVVASH